MSAVTVNEDFQSLKDDKNRSSTAPDSAMGRDLRRLLAIRDWARSFLMGRLPFGLMLDGLESWSDFEQLGDRWQREFVPHLEVLYVAFERADSARSPLPTRDDRSVADAASAIVALVSKLLGDDLPVVLPDATAAGADIS